MDDLIIINKMLRNQLHEKNKEIEYLRKTIKKLEACIEDTDKLFEKEQYYKKDCYKVFTLASDELKELK